MVIAAEAIRVISRGLSSVIVASDSIDLPVLLLFNIVAYSGIIVLFII